MSQYRLVFLFVIITKILLGQANDDLHALSTSDDPQIAAKAYKDLALAQCTDSLSLHVTYAKKGIALARSVDNDTLVGNILMNLGTCHEINHKFEQAIAYFDSAEAIFLGIEGVDD